MKIKKYALAILCVLSVNFGFSQRSVTDNLTFSPPVSYVAVNSGTFLNVGVTVIRTGTSSTNQYYSVIPATIPDNGFLSLSPGSGFLSQNSSVVINFSFYRTVTSTTTSHYRFWFIYGSQYYPIDIHVTYIASSCPASINITTNVTSGQTDNQSAQNSITASNDIESGGVANYDAGSQVVLKPGFHAKSGSVFRAYIDGCTQNRQLAEKISNKSVPSITYDTMKGNAEKDTSVGVNVYPNPATDHVKVISGENIKSLSLFNRYGKVILRDKVNSKISEVRLDKLPKGFYYLELTTETGEIVRKKIIKN